MVSSQGAKAPEDPILGTRGRTARANRDRADATGTKKAAPCEPVSGREKRPASS